MRARNERRHRVLWVREWLIADILNLASGASSPEAFDLPHLQGLPEDTYVESVWHDPMRKCFGLLLSHPDFEPVPDGIPAPEHHMERISVRLIEFRRSASQIGWRAPE